jgi:hypothetical protein
VSLDLEPIRKRLADIKDHYEAVQFYDDPRLQIPVDLEALIEEVELLREALHYTDMTHR